VKKRTASTCLGGGELIADDQHNMSITGAGAADYPCSACSPSYFRAVRLLPGVPDIP